MWKGTVSAQFWAIRPKLCGNCAFPQNFHTGKLGEIAIIFTVMSTFSDHKNLSGFNDHKNQGSFFKKQKYLPIYGGIH